jgi:hypothetical protein
MFGALNRDRSRDEFAEASFVSIDIAAALHEAGSADEAADSVFGGAFFSCVRSAVHGRLQRRLRERKPLFHVEHSRLQERVRPPVTDVPREGDVDRSG